ncbi:MAG: hypothetical protein JXR37_32870 [Kiritimatiellae bacterium]|nr:hypothetical protein [Kiritimatiellia bacterium]
MSTGATSRAGSIRIRVLALVLLIGTPLLAQGAPGDADDDGMSDKWENYYGLNASDPADAAQDPDRDRRSNLREFEDQTDPFRRDRAPAMPPPLVNNTVPWCDDEFGYPCRTILAAIDDAVPGDTITIADGVYSQRLEISKSVTLVGSRNTILREPDTFASPIEYYTEKGPRLYVTAGAVCRAVNLTVEGVDCRGGGGVSNWGDLTLERVKVVNNRADRSADLDFGEVQRGAGIYNRGTLRVVESLVAGNIAGGFYGGSWGGGIYNGPSAYCLVLRSTVTANAAGGMPYSSWFGNAAVDSYGGGICNYGSLVVSASTISGNEAAGWHAWGLPSGLGHGWGSAIYSEGELTIVSSTIVDNHSISSYGRETDDPAVDVHSGSSQIGNSIIAENCSPTGTAFDVGGPFESLGCNLLGRVAIADVGGDATGNLYDISPMLLPLGDYGGPTPTHLPAWGSPVIDAGKHMGYREDQRLERRPRNIARVPNAADGTDIGAVEVRLRDDDRDGMPTDWEYTCGLDPRNWTDWAGDPDGDGLWNRLEFLLGLNPQDPDSNDDGIPDGLGRLSKRKLKRW